MEIQYLIFSKKNFEEEDLLNDFGLKKVVYGKIRDVYITKSLPDRTILLKMRINNNNDCGLRIYTYDSLINVYRKYSIFFNESEKESSIHFSYEFELKEELSLYGLEISEIINTNITIDSIENNNINNNYLRYIFRIIILDIPIDEIFKFGYLYF